MPNGGTHLVSVAELRKVKHAAGVNYLALKAMAEQLLPEEIDDPDGADYETGYEAMIRIARLAVERGEP